MALNAWEMKLTHPDVWGTYVKIVGVTTGPTITKVYGRGVTVTRTAAGVISLVWLDPPGTYLGITGAAFEATTAADVKGYTVTGGAWTASTKTLVISLWDNSNAAVDLVALQWVSLLVLFSQTS